MCALQFVEIYHKLEDIGLFHTQLTLDNFVVSAGSGSVVVTGLGSCVAIDAGERPMGQADTAHSLVSICPKHLLALASAHPPEQGHLVHLLAVLIMKHNSACSHRAVSSWRTQEGHSWALAASSHISARQALPGSLK